MVHNAVLSSFTVEETWSVFAMTFIYEVAYLLLTVQKNSGSLWTQPNFQQQQIRMWLVVYLQGAIRFLLTLQFCPSLSINNQECLHEFDGLMVEKTAE